MTIARRLIFTTIATVVCLTLITASAVWGLNSLSRHLDDALEDYDDLQTIYEIGLHAKRAQELFQSYAEDAEVSHELFNTELELTEFLGEEEAASDNAVKAAYALQTAVLNRKSDEDHLDIDNQFNLILGRIAQLATQTTQHIRATQQQANESRTTSFNFVFILATFVICGACVVSFLQYSSIMTPLNHLRRGVKMIAYGNFADRLNTDRGGEFAQVATDFNNMAKQLEDFYSELEKKVREKSQELVRTERLASVGFLAAGVAHEINNPLNIMSGYAELSLKKLNLNKPNAKEETTRALEIITEETFRCKRIIERLLGLTRGGDESRDDVAMSKVVDDVIEMVDGLPRYRKHQLQFEKPHQNTENKTTSDEKLTVFGNETELKQVLLNLTINALEAVDKESGRVKIKLEQVGPYVEISVADNGKGMTQQTLERVFEPFYTEKRGTTAPDEQSGTGLGLAITHAIIQQHGGSITASSPGLGSGSTFKFHIPISKN